MRDAGRYFLCVMTAPVAVSQLIFIQLPVSDFGLQPTRLHRVPQYHPNSRLMSSICYIEIHNQNLPGNTKWQRSFGLSKHALQWLHNECDGVSHHQIRDCLLNRLFKALISETSKLHVSNSCTNEPGGRLNKKDGLTRYGNSHVKDKTS